MYAKFQTLVGSEGGCCLDLVDEALSLVTSTESMTNITVKEEEFVIRSGERLDVSERIRTLLPARTPVGIYLDDIKFEEDEYDFGGWLAHAFLLFEEDGKIYILQKLPFEPTTLDLLDLEKFLPRLVDFISNPKQNLDFWKEYFYESLYVPKDEEIEHYLLRLRYPSI